MIPDFCKSCGDTIPKGHGWCSKPHCVTLKGLSVLPHQHGTKEGLLKFVMGPASRHGKAVPPGILARFEAVLRAYPYDEIPEAVFWEPFDKACAQHHEVCLKEQEVFARNKAKADATEFSAAFDWGRTLRRNEGFDNAEILFRFRQLPPKVQQDWIWLASDDPGDLLPGPCGCPAGAVQGTYWSSRRCAECRRQWSDEAQFEGAAEECDRLKDAMFSVCHQMSASVRPTPTTFKGRLGKVEIAVGHIDPTRGREWFDPASYESSLSVATQLESGTYPPRLGKY